MKNVVKWEDRWDIEFNHSKWQVWQQLGPGDSNHGPYIEG